MINRRTTLAGLALTALTALAGCASDPVPTEQMRLTEQALEQAKAVGANADVAEYKLAEDKYQAAQGALKGASNKQARQLAEQAELDARLAEARVLTRKSTEQLAEQGKSIDRLRRQLGEAK